MWLMTVGTKVNGRGIIEEVQIVDYPPLTPLLPPRALQAPGIYPVSLPVPFRSVVHREKHQAGRDKFETVVLLR